MPAVHDRGGLPADGPIDRTDHQWEDWEHVTNALVGVLRRQNLINVDELRRGIEAMAREEYESSSYYERWSASIGNVACRERHPHRSRDRCRGCETGLRVGTLGFRAGDPVTVRATEVDHHHRTPWFVKGKQGKVRLVHGEFFNPESRAHGGDGLPKRRLCHVEFQQIDIWGAGYRGSADDVLLVDLFEHWLERP